MNGQIAASNQAFIGIDPGKSGAIAVFRPRVGRLDIFDMPTLEITRNGKTKHELSPIMLANQLSDFQHLQPIPKVIMERVGAMPGQGVTSAFNFGFTTGCIHGIIAACGIEIRTVSPQVWKRKYGLIGQNKDASRGEASRRFPEFTHLWSLKKHDGRAEAALLALYGSEMT